jgi:type I restriction enzyme S subunit
MDGELPELPTGWLSVRLGDVVSRARPKVPADPKSDLPFIGMDHIEAHSFNLLGQDSFARMKSAGSYFEEGDVLYGRLRPYLNKVHRAKFKGVASAEFIVLPSSQSHDSDFLKLLLHQRRFIEFAMSRASGDRPRVKFESIAEFEFGLPPLSEQRRIVEKIETLFARLNKGEEAVRHVQTLLKRSRQSVLKAAMTGQLTADWREANVVERWREIELGDITDFLTSGSRGWAEYYAADGALFIRAQNLKYDRLDLEDVAFVRLPARSEGTRTRVNRGDLLITITGANVTKSAIVDVDLGEAYVSQHVGLLRLNDEADPEFVYWFLVAKAGGRKQLEAFAYGAGKPGLNLTNIREVRLELPSLPEQREIVQRIQREISRSTAVEKWCEHELTRSIALRQSILKQAFSGRLVPQDPSDEPASDLLARIRSAAPNKKLRRAS